MPEKRPGMGIYKRKKESEQETYHAGVHEKKNSVKKTWTRPRKKVLAQENTHQESVHEKKNSFKKYALVQEGVQEIKNSSKKKKTRSKN